MRIGIIVNDIFTEKENYTTTQLAMVAARNGHEVWYLDVAHFASHPDDRVYAHAVRAPSHAHRKRRIFLEEVRALARKGRQRIAVGELDVLLPRNDPSLDALARPWAREASIDFGRLAAREGVLVLNDPDGLALGLNKLYMEYFPESVRPRTLITRDKDEAKDFIAAQGGYAVLKPLAGSGGRNVFLVRPHDTPNINQMIEAVSRDGYYIVQEFVPEVIHGDTRLFLLDARPFKLRGRIAAIHRQRRTGDADIRSNLTAGAIARPAEVTSAMLELAEAIRPRLERDGIFFAGIDIIGDRIMEVNIQSPGGLVEAEEFEGVPFHRALLEAMERKLHWRRTHPGTDNRALAAFPAPDR
jgi:glutathione synthase